MRTRRRSVAIERRRRLAITPTMTIPFAASGMPPPGLSCRKSRLWRISPLLRWRQPPLRCPNFNPPV
jgi:hypothetical protein